MMGQLGKTYTNRVKARRIQEEEHRKVLNRKIDKMFENYKRPIIWNYLYAFILVVVMAALMYFVASNLIILLEFMGIILEWIIT